MAQTNNSLEPFLITRSGSPQGRSYERAHRSRIYREYIHQQRRTTQERAHAHSLRSERVTTNRCAVSATHTRAMKVHVMATASRRMSLCVWDYLR